MTIADLPVIPSGLHGTRILSNALAMVWLRKLKKIVPPKSRATSGRAWADGEIDDALMERKRGLSDKQIAQKHKRTIKAIRSKIGHQYSETHRKYVVRTS